MIASLESTTIVQFFGSLPWLEPLFRMTSKLTPYLLVTGVFTFLYIYLPNTPVTFRAALVGGVAGGSIWASMSVAFATFVAISTRTQLIYAGFAVAVLTLIWLYLNWLILLIGAQLAFYYQNPAFLRIGRREPRLSNTMRERLALNIMLLVGQAFRGAGTTASIESLAESIRIPSITLIPIITALEKGGLLTSTEQDKLVPGREMARIRLRDILDVVREHGETGSYRTPQWAHAISNIGGKLDAAVAAAVGDDTLADLLDQSEVRAAGI